MPPLKPVTPSRAGIVYDPTTATCGDDRIAPIVTAIDQAPFSSAIARLCPREATAEHLSLVHTPPLVDQVYRTALDANNQRDPASRFEPGLCRAALRAVGSVIAAVDAVMAPPRDGPERIFALESSPGHHATANRALGHCLLNNVAIAARYAQRTYHLDRVMILDWDAHHGSGTEEIFADDPSVLTVSLHQWPLYPGTGWFTDLGHGHGRGFSVNIPLLPGSGDATHRAAFSQIVEPIAAQFAPDLLLISAGQDCHAAHPLTDLLVSFDGFRSMAQSACRIADRHCHGRIVLSLESGYNPHTPPWLIAGILATMGDLPFTHRDPFTPRRRTAPSPAHKRRLRDVASALSTFWELDSAVNR